MIRIDNENSAIELSFERLIDLRMRMQILPIVLIFISVTVIITQGNIFAQNISNNMNSADSDTIYLHPVTGNDTNPGTQDAPLRTLAATARQVNESIGSEAITIILAEGIYAMNETAIFEPDKRSFSKERRLTIRAEVLPDDPEWHTGRMPTLMHTMPLSSTWMGRPDPFGGE